MANEVCSLIVAGDLAPIGRPEILLTKGLVREVFGNVLGVVEESDCFVANLECPLTTGEHRRSKVGRSLKAHPAVAPALERAGISVLSLANNHIFDYGLQGVRDTIRVLNTHSIAWCGVGESAEKAARPLFISVGGVRIGLLSYAEHEFNWQDDRDWCTSLLDPAENVLQIQSAACQCDRVVVLLHSGPENWHYPSPRMVKMCRAFARAGASAVLVSHAHAIMGTEYEAGVPIVYGLGNFMFDDPLAAGESWTQGLIVQLRFTTAQETVVRHIGVEMNTETGRLDILTGDAEERFREYYRALSAPLADMNQVEDYWNAFCRSQIPHMVHEILKGTMAMVPGLVARRLLRINPARTSTSYFTKGSTLLRGLLTCENHVDVLSRICDMLRKGNA
jgi:poly-gamma-glutamate synthesis protein (capsule biosynthesis protein)